MFAVYSAMVIYRAFVTKATLFLMFAAAAVLCDIAVTFALQAHQIPIAPNIVVFGYLVGAIVVQFPFFFFFFFFFKIPNISHLWLLLLLLLVVSLSLSLVGHEPPLYSCVGGLLLRRLLCQGDPCSQSFAPVGPLLSQYCGPLSLSFFHGHSSHHLSLSCSLLVLPPQALDL